MKKTNSIRSLCGSLLAKAGMQTNPPIQNARRDSRLASHLGALLAASALATVATPSAQGDVIFTRTTLNGESWVPYSATFTPTKSGAYTLSFNITAADTRFNHPDNSIFLDDVRVSSTSTLLFQSGFETPALAGSGSFQYPANGNGTVVAGDWAFTDYSGLINGVSSSLWGPLNAAEGSQRGLVQAYTGTLSHITTANTIPLVAGQSYTVTFDQASRPGNIGNEGVLTYTVAFDFVPPAVPTIDFGVPQRTDWGLGASFGHIFSKTGLPDVLSSHDGQSTFVNLWKNNGDGTFADTADFFLPGGLGGNNTEQSVLADMNNDGFDDIVAIARSGLAIFLNDGQGNFTQSALYPEDNADNDYFPADFESVKMAVGKSSPTGNVDVIVTGAGSGGLSKVLVFHGNGDGTLAANPVSLNIAHGYLAPSIEFADVSRDGYSAVVATGAWGNPLKVFHNNRDGTYTESFTLDAADQNEFLSNAQFIDMDQDGTLDLVVATGDTAPSGWVGTIYWCKGLGNATYSTTRNVAFTGAAERWTGSDWAADWFYDTLTAADIDGDGQIDLIGSTQNARIAVLRNNGDGTFAKVWESSQIDTQGRVAFAAKVFYVDVTGTGPSLIGANGVFNAFQTFSSFGEYWGPMLNGKPTENTPPVITAPADITTEATGPSGAVVNFTATAQDNVDGSVNVTASPASGSNFPLGTTTVNLSASDAAGNTAQSSFTVTVRDTTPPVISAPTSVVAEATSAAGAPVTLDATANDLVSGNVPVTANPASGSTFTIGFSSVSLSATDAAGNTATKVILVQVQDTTAPTLSVPASQVLEATSAAGATASFAATATDAVGVTALNYSAPSGSTFPIGVTTVTVTAKDAAGNSTSGSFTITVRDTTAPALVTPASQVLEATSAAGATTTFAANATDAVGVTSLIYSAASGSTLPIGITTVSVKATDAAGNSSSGSFTVTVRDTTAPVIGSITPSITSIWPPNKKMVAVTIKVVATDVVGIASAKIISVATSQPDKNTQWQITGPLTVNLLADRNGGDCERIYTITIEVRDAAGNITTKTTTVTVPHDQSGKSGDNDGKNDNDDHGQNGDNDHGQNGDDNHR